MLTYKLCWLDAGDETSGEVIDPPVERVMEIGDLPTARSYATTLMVDYMRQVRIVRPDGKIEVYS